MDTVCEPIHAHDSRVFAWKGQGLVSFTPSEQAARVWGQGSILVQSLRTDDFICVINTETLYVLQRVIERMLCLRVHVQHDAWRLLNIP